MLADASELWTPRALCIRHWGHVRRIANRARNYCRLSAFLAKRVCE